MLTKSPLLYADEELIELTGYPAMFKYIPGNIEKPLIVFVPGASHLARIAYGYPGSNQKDFLAFWLHKKGYPFLAVSYPIENNVFKKVYPDFTIKDWSQQVALAVRMIVDKYHLSRKIVVAAWSFAGYTAVRVNKAFAENNLICDLFIGLSADPPLRGLFNPNPSLPYIKILPNGMVSPKPLSKWFNDWFFQQVHMQNKLNSHVIIPKKIYQRQFIGNSPVALLGTKIRYNNGKFIDNIAGTLADTQGFDYENYPAIALINDKSITDDQNALFTSFDWSAMLTRSLYGQIRKELKSEKAIKENWNQIVLFLSKTLQKYTKIVTPGNHFFFIGERGARKTTLLIQSLINNKVSDMNSFRRNRVF